MAELLHALFLVANAYRVRMRAHRKADRKNAGGSAGAVAASGWAAGSRRSLAAARPLQRPPGTSGRGRGCNPTGRRAGKVVMGLFGDRYVARYEGHAVELLRNNW